MAIDTKQKRMSAMNHASPWRGPMVDATESGTTQGNRQAAAFMYSGILATAVNNIYNGCAVAASVYLHGGKSLRVHHHGAKALRTHQHGAKEAGVYCE